jgi:hypothetical protein
MVTVGRIHRAMIEEHLRGLPGSYRRTADAPWTLVAPAAGMPRLLAEPMPSVSVPGEPQYATVKFRDDAIWIHPGLIPDTWARAQGVVSWLLGLGPWHVTGDAQGRSRDLGLIQSPSELFDHLYADPDIPRLDPRDPTASPPRVGVLTTFRRYLGDVDAGGYHHMFVRVHESGAFSCDQRSDLENVRWEGRLQPDLVARFRAMVAALDFGQSSPGWEGDFRDRVAVIVERPGEERTKTLDAEHPPTSFGEVARLMDSWAQDLLDGKTPDELSEVRTVPGPARSSAHQ